MRNALIAGLFAAIAPAAFASFAVDLPIVTRAQGATTTFYTAIDVTNQSTAATDVTFEYLSADLTVNASGTLVSNLAPHVNFHQDDLIQYLGDQGYISSDKVASTFGTLLLTFTNPSFTTGNEASASARIWNYLNSGQRPSIGLAYRAIPLRLNGSHTVTSVIQDTSATTGGPSVVTNMGLENIGIDDAGSVSSTPVTIQLTFYDGSSGTQIGPQPSITLQPGQVNQINNVWGTYGLPTSTNNVIVVATETAGTAQIRGYVSLKDTATNDGSFFFMQ
ncbi:MAG TPA: hypothetical protein VLV86_05135 [Vicinamibacterales bacterium]|nr:hypothetical protein [Thermoanaerobaculia bacterium]HUK33269.1 hypothetical protein [Vicinamibacterales bacterium]